MTYDATAHATQMALLHHLLLRPSAGFAELQRAAQIESDYCNFHLKQLTKGGYVHKNDDGKYTLTADGKEYANRMDTDEKVVERQPKISAWLVVENNKGEFLAQQRLKQPYFGFWGRVSGKIRWGEELLETAERELLEETGLTADLKPKGVYHKIDYRKSDNSLLEDKYFYLIHGTNPKGTLQVDFEGGKNAWMTDKEMAAKDKVFDSALEASKLIRKPHFFFIEVKHYYDEKDY